MTIYMAVMDSLVLQAENKGVMLKWADVPVVDIKDSEKLTAEQDDSAFTLLSSLGLITLGAFLL